MIRIPKEFMNNDKVHSFNSARSFQMWLKKNHLFEKEIWIHFYKKSYFQEQLTYNEAVDLCLCYGWVYGKIKSIDFQSYKVKFVQRRKKSVWSVNMMKRFKELKKKGKTHSSGEAAFKNRDINKSKNIDYQWTSSQLKVFKKNKKAWDFFNQQSNSYIKYMKSWVLSAKRIETQEKRFQELLEDSANETKLKRILSMIEKYKPKYEKGKTPIEAAKNIGPICGAELRQVGITTLEKLVDAGWEEVFLKLCESHPHRLNLNMLRALVGAVENQSWKNLEPHIKAEAKQFLRQLKREYEDYSI